MFRLREARTASRTLFCCTRKAGFEPGNGACQAPHSSTVKVTFFSGSYLSITASCLRRNSSMKRVDLRVFMYSSTPNFSEFVDGGQPLGTVYQCSETPLMSQAQVCFFQAFIRPLSTRCPASRDPR